jgi:hypothetical protein
VPEIERMSAHLAQVHGLAPAWVREFWSWPYRDVIDFVHRLASSAEERQAYGFPKEYLTSLPGVELSDRTSPDDLIVQKIMRERLLVLRMLFEFCSSDPERISEAIEIKGLEHLEAAAVSGNPVILATTHVGIGQIGPHILAQFGFPITVLGGGLPTRLLGLPGHEKLQLLRPKDQGPLVVAKGMEALKAGRFLVMAADGRQGRAGDARRFLGKIRIFKSGLNYCATRAQARVIPWQATVNSVGSPTLEVFPEIAPMHAGCSDDERAEAITMKYRDLLEWTWINHFGNVSDGDVQEYLALPDAPPQVR